MSRVAIRFVASDYRRTVRYAFQAQGFCTYTGLQTFNPLEVNSPFITGNTQAYGLAVSGGSEAMTYYLSGQFDKDKGVYEINQLRHATLRANATAHLGPKFDLTVNSSYGQNRLRLPQNDNNVRGVIPSGILGLVFDDSVNHGFGSNSRRTSSPSIPSRTPSATPDQQRGPGGH